jgi:hypothetical protein
VYSNGPLDNSPAPPLGAGMSDFLLGRFSQAQVSQPSKAANLSTYQGIYFQDDWKVTPRLTVNIGLRYEREGPPTERFNRALAGFDSTVDNPAAGAAKAAYAAGAPIAEIPPSAFQVRGGVIFAGVNGASRQIYKTDGNNFAPRIGLAFQPASNTVVRAGYGLYYIPYGQRFFANEGGVPGFDVNSLAFASSDNGLTFTRTLDNPFPGGLDKPTGSALGISTFVGQALNLRPYGDNPNAYNQRWLLSVQQRLASVWKLEARYVGNHTVKMPVTRNLNALPNSQLSTSPERDDNNNNRLTGLVANPFFGINNVGGAIGTSRTIARSQLLRPYPEFANISFYNNQGWSTYHALQVELERSLSNGLTIQSSYTFSKTMDGLSFLNEGDPVTEKAISIADRPHIFRFIALYELPFGKGRRFGAGWNGVVRYAISGWQAQAISFVQSGVPLGWGNILFRGNIKDIAVDSQRPERMFNTGAGFETDSRKQLVSNLRTFPSALAGIRTNRETNTDFSIIKNNSLGERFSLQFRAEAYNAFNQHFFSTGVNTNPANAAFGTSTSASSPRAVQLGLKLIF